MPEIPTLGAKELLWESLKTKSGIVAYVMLVVLVGLVIVLPIVAPGDVIRSWGNIEAWTDNPRNAAPEWVDVFTPESLARTMILERGDFRKSASDPTLPLKVILLRGVFQFEYDTFPSELGLEIHATWQEKVPNIRVIWQRPDGEELTLVVYTPQVQTPEKNVISISKNDVIQEAVRNWGLGLGANDSQFIRPDVSLFAEVGPNMLVPRNATVLNGRYVVRLETIAFEQADDVDARFLSLGVVHGLAGTDDRRRDLLIGLLWGARSTRLRSSCGTRDNIFPGSDWGLRCVFRRQMG